MIDSSGSARAAFSAPAHRSIYARPSAEPLDAEQRRVESDLGVPHRAPRFAARRLPFLVAAALAASPEQAALLARSFAAFVG